MALAVLVASDSDFDRHEKRPGAFRTIGEVADDLGIPQHVLRFWEGRFGQIRPLKRAGGRRYYRPDDVDLLKGIQRLLHSQGYTIKGVQRVLKENGIRFVQAIGRGEAEGIVPPLQECGTEFDVASVGAAPEAEALLHELLNELRACRRELATLHPGMAVQP